MACDYCRANREGIEFQAKNRPKGSFNELLRQYGSIRAVREVLSHERDDKKRCTCHDLRLKFQFQFSLDRNTTKTKREELDTTLQEILTAYKNKRCSKKSTISLLSNASSAVDVQHCRNALWKIHVVDLSHCQIKELPASFGSILVGLRKLNLDCNLLENLPDLSKCSLEHLNLARNKFTILPSWLTRQKTLTYLNISFNHFRSTLFEKIKPYTIDVVEEDKKINDSRNWIESVDYYDPNKVLYFNKITGDVSNKKGHGKFCKENKLNDSVHLSSIKIEKDVHDTTFFSVKELIMNNNMCTSCVLVEVNCMTSLVVLKIQKNKISSLPSELCHLVSLRILDASENELKIIPDLGACIALEDINISSNNIEEFPNFLLTLKNLRSLDISCNKVRQIPLALGLHESLSAFRAYDNPIDDLPKEIFAQHTNSLWELRQLHYKKQRGGLPLVQIAFSGIRKEHRALAPEFDISVSEKIEAANSRCQALFLRNQNLSQIPDLIYKSNNLSSICLQGNPISTLDWKELSVNLISLDLRDCGLKKISESIGLLPNLQDLNIEGNNLIHLPKQLEQLHELKRFFCSNNQVRALPETFATNLVELHLNHNCLNELPENLNLLQDLKVLGVSHNKLHSLPSSITMMTKLRSLNLRQNNLNQLPQKLGHLHLTHLFLSNNQIQVLPHDFFLPNLGGTITDLELNGNELSELPPNLPLCNNAIIDMNPLKSPPLSLINEGFEAIVNYNNIRYQRITEFVKGLKKSGFVTSQNNFSPPATKVIGQTGYLSPKDLMEFDSRVDDCVNGEFFHKKYSVKDIIKDIFDLRRRREEEVYIQILDCVLSELNSIKKENPQRWLFRDDIKKKFGFLENKVECFAIPLRFVLLDHGNASTIFNKVKSRLCELDSLFSFDNTMLSESFNYNSPFGQVAAVEHVKYTDGLDNDKSLPSLIIAKHIYSKEEAERRRREESILFSYFAKMDDLVAAWALTKEGIRSINAEVSQRIKNTSKLCNDLKRELRLFRSESNDKIQRIRNRLKDYDEKQPYDLHFIADENAAQQLRLKLTETEKETGEIFASLEQKYSNAQQKKEENWPVVKNQAFHDMKTKCSYRFYELVYRNGRAHALMNELERPWDEKGFYKYKEKCLEGKASRVVIEENKFREKLEKVLEKVDFVWTDMTNMEKYDDNEPYMRFRSSPNFLNRIKGKQVQR